MPALVADADRIDRFRQEPRGGTRQHSPGRLEAFGGGESDSRGRGRCRADESAGARGEVDAQRHRVPHRQSRRVPFRQGGETGGKGGVDCVPLQSRVPHGGHRRPALHRCLSNDLSGAMARISRLPLGYQHGFRYQGTDARHGSAETGGPLDRAKLVAGRRWTGFHLQRPD